MTKHLPKLAVALGAAALLLYPSSTPQAQAQYVLKFGTVAPDFKNPWADQLRDTKARIERDSQGAIKVNLFLGGQLGGEVEMVQDCRKGERLQGVGVSAGAMSAGANVPMLDMTELPYLFRSYEEVDAVLDTVMYTPVTEELKKKGFVLGIWAENGWRSFATKGPASTPAELAQFKMRAQESEIHYAMYEALGVQYVAKPTSEVRSALQNGIVDGFDNTPLFSLVGGWIDPSLVTHYTVSEHIYQPAVVAYSAAWYATLPADLQKIVLGDPTMEAAKGRANVRSENEKMFENMEAMGVKVVRLSPDQKKVFAEKTQGVHQIYLKKHPEFIGLYKQVVAKLQAMRK